MRKSAGSRRKRAARRRRTTTSAWAQKAIALAPARPEGFNLLGVIHELRHERLQAQKCYRAALALDPTYQPAQNNLHWSIQVSKTGTLDLGAGQ